MMTARMTADAGKGIAAAAGADIRVVTGAAIRSSRHGDIKAATAVAAAKPEADRADILIEEDIKPSLGQMAGDAKRLRQVFDQLLAATISGFAASDRTPPGGRRIMVVAEGDAREGRIILSDNGDGKPPSGVHAVAVALARQLVVGHDGELTTQHEAGQGALTSIRLAR